MGCKTFMVVLGSLPELNDGLPAIRETLNQSVKVYRKCELITAPAIECTSKRKVNKWSYYWRVATKVPSPRI